MHSIASSMVSALLPRRCASCGTPLDRGEQDWCLPCDFTWSRASASPVDRFEDPGVWAWGASWLRMKGPEERRLVHALKYGGTDRIGQGLGRAMGREFAENGQLSGLTGWATVPIPLHARRRRQRGFNQSEALAEGWNEVTGMAIARVLIRPRSGKSLTQLDRSQRIRSTQGLYIPDPSLDPTRLDGIAGCLLLDDVITTGSTLASAREALTSIWKGPIGFITLLDAIR